MCFSKEMSAAFSALGFLAALWVWVKTTNKQLAFGIFFFVLMELLQTIQYFFIAPNIDSPICDTLINQFLTIAGYFHLCLQPYVVHVLHASVNQDPKFIDRFRVIQRLSLIGGAMLFGRFLLSDVWPQTLVGPSTEWMRGPKLCTFQGSYHLAWSVPLADPTYLIPSITFHSFLMFAPSFAMYEKKALLIRSTLLFIFGPILASYITSNLMEQASVWCLFSIAQVFVFLFAVRRRLIPKSIHNTDQTPSTTDNIGKKRQSKKLT